MVYCLHHGHMCREHCGVSTPTQADIPIHSIADAENEISALSSELQALTSAQEVTNDIIQDLLTQNQHKKAVNKHQPKQVWHGTRDASVTTAPSMPSSSPSKLDIQMRGVDVNTNHKHAHLHMDLPLSRFHHYFDQRAGGYRNKGKTQNSEHQRHLQPWLQKVMASKAVDLVSSVVVIFNTILIAIKTDVQAGTYGDDVDVGILEHLSLACLIFFTCEVLLRMLSVGCKVFFVGPDCGWNWFDTVIISVGITEEVVVHGFDGGSDASASGAIVGSRAFRLLRIMRVVRVLRIARGFRQLRLLVKGILGSFKALFWTALLLLLGFVVFGIAMVRLLQEEILNKDACNDGDSIECDVHSVSTFYFPSVERSLFTLFGFMTDGWVDVAVVLIQRHPGIWIFFVTFITLATIAVLNIVTGVFVEQTLAAGREDEENMIRDQLAQKNSFTNELKKFFELADTDKNGFLTWREFEKDLQNPRIVGKLEHLELSVDEAKGLFKLIDVDGSGSVSIDEFIMGACRVKGTAKAVDVVTIMYESAKMVEEMRQMESELNLKIDRLSAQAAQESAKDAAFKASLDPKLDLLRKRIEQVA
eukprot:gnl/MRDRNA2_/MRDRNA2_93057_c0_seq1.p1 gnl/MRDRNA2_/MRDRNA2_93057_c0~~gnl/MRDRNA2_/MRDRNA2_93057_c0_seq1.p1  ORF type:complete len:588 (-),score=93.98 gnl/MRDRNA2_/MRDRNA2_93057_c0_seq1:169-1932(-)